MLPVTSNIRSILSSTAVITLLIFSLMPTMTLAAAKITIINGDGTGEGFNDTTAYTAQGGNYATTLGQARLNAFQYAANLLAMYLESSIEIRVNAYINPLGGNNPITLGSAAPTTVARDFTNAPVASTWYAISVAEKLAGTELNGGADISSTFNSDVDRADTMSGNKFYYGFDQSPGADVDFVTVVLHELIHGLGFISLVNLTTGEIFSSFNDAYMRHLEHHGSTPADYPSMTNTQRVTASTATNLLHWTGTNVLANDTHITTGKSNDHIEMYAPSTAASGSSVSHFDTDVGSASLPNELMEPAYASSLHNPGLAIQVLADVGWSPVNTATGSADLQLAIADSADPVNAGSNVSYTVTVTNNGPNSAAQSTLTLFIPTTSSFVSATPSQGSCRRVDSIVTCVLGTIANAATPTVVLTVTPSQGGNHILATTVSSITTDGTNTNNRINETTSISPISDLQISLSDSGDPVISGESFTYTASITNGGPSNAASTVATITLPADATYVSATPSQGSCTRSGVTMTCSLGTVNSGNTPTVSITLRTLLITTLNVSASVTSSSTDNSAANNTAAITTTVIASPKFTGGDGGGCFIATAAYGSVLTKDVDTLRNFRDHYLLTNIPGQWFIKNYYRYSPPVADKLAQSPELKALMKGLLFPLVGLSRLLADSEKNIHDGKYTHSKKSVH